MVNNFWESINLYFQENIFEYMNSLNQNPIKIVALVLDLSIVIYLVYKFLKIEKNSRLMQLIKGIALYVVLTALSSLLNLQILKFILTSVMSYGVIALIVIFQPELRRALEQLGSNKLTRFVGLEKDMATRSKEDIYKVVVTVEELSKTKTGGLIVFERDIKLKDIIDSGIRINSDVSPQLLVNIFTPNTPLHDGAVIISENKIASAACILPLASDKEIAKELGTRHRAALGISKETDAIVVVVSEETGKISIAIEGKLILDVKEDVLKRILIKNIANRFEENNYNKVEKFKQKFKKKNN
ncbi:MAG TPA: diadenylate cyclase CdaA [Clostridia bacterium]|nr:diadenylate cyclase CdaA [Clostridia bacterium]